MEQVVSKNAPYSRYGSDILKQAYIYGALDMSPTILTRSFGFGWNIGGWLLFSFLQKASTETAERLRQRVRDGLTTTFASHYKARISLKGALSRSEEHTSELQSLMRISYAVFFLKKKTT